MSEDKKGLIKKTDDKCPVSGYWQSVTETPQQFFFKEGETLPDLGKGGVINWVFVNPKQH